MILNIVRDCSVASVHPPLRSWQVVTERVHHYHEHETLFPSLRSPFEHAISLQICTLLFWTSQTGPSPYPLKSGIISTNAMSIDPSDPHTILWLYRRSRLHWLLYSIWALICSRSHRPCHPRAAVIQSPTVWQLTPSPFARDVGNSRTASWMPAQILPLVASPVRLSNNFDILRLGCWLHEADLGSRSLDFELGPASAIAFQLPQRTWVFTHL